MQGLYESSDADIDETTHHHILADSEDEFLRKSTI